MKWLLTISSLAVLLAGCVGSPVRNTWTYDAKQSAIKRNNQNLLNLQIGQTATQVKQIMGQPEQSEGYDWGTVWLYRTAFTSGIYGTADSDFTPLVFDSSGHLQGWGRNFFEERVKKSDITIHTQQ